MDCNKMTSDAGFEDDDDFEEDEEEEEEEEDTFMCDICNEDYTTSELSKEDGYVCTECATLTEV